MEEPFPSLGKGRRRISLVEPCKRRGSEAGKPSEAYAESAGEEEERRSQGGRALVGVKQSQSDCEQSVTGTAQSDSGKKGHKIFSSELYTVHHSKAGIDAVGWKAQVNSHL